MASAQQIAYIQQRSAALGLDPKAVLAIAGHEGLSGGIGDGGHAFGPFQENNAGGVLTGQMQGETPEQINQWAWSPAGIDSALGKIAGVAKGLTGNAAITAIASRFERPKNVAGEISDAEAHYGANGGMVATPIASGATSGGTSADVNAGGTMSRQQLANLVFNGNGINFNSSQIEPANLMALTQARLQAAAQAPQAGDPSVVPQSGPPTTWKGGSPVAGLTSTGPEHATEGLPGYPAHDYFATAGSGVTAPITGKVVRLSGHPPADGPIDGPHGPLGWSVYIQGRDGHTYYLTHMGSRNVSVGQVVKAGQDIGTVANYAKYGTPSHIHMGVH